MQARLRLKLGKKVLAENTTLKEQYEHYEIEVGDVRLLLEKPGFEEAMGGSKELDVILQLTPSGTIDPKFEIVKPKDLKEHQKQIEEREKEEAEERAERRKQEAEEQEKQAKAAEANGFALLEQEQERRRSAGQPPLEVGQVGEVTDPRRRETASAAEKSAFKGGTWADWDSYRDSRRKELGLDKAEENRKSAAKRVSRKK